MWIIFLFYNIIIKCLNVDKGGEGGGKTLIHKMWIKNMFVFLNPSLRKEITGINQSQSL